MAIKRRTAEPRRERARRVGNRFRGYPKMQSFSPSSLHPDAFRQRNVTIHPKIIAPCFQDLRKARSSYSLLESCQTGHPEHAVIEQGKQVLPRCIPSSPRMPRLELHRPYLDFLLPYISCPKRKELSPIHSEETLRGRCSFYSLSTRLTKENFVSQPAFWGKPCPLSCLTCPGNGAKNARVLPLGYENPMNLK